MNEIECLITSQIDTAPKRVPVRPGNHVRLITSQIDTAPKLPIERLDLSICLITSQIDTGPRTFPRTWRYAA